MRTLFVTLAVIGAAAASGCAQSTDAPPPVESTPTPPVEPTPAPQPEKAAPTENPVENPEKAKTPPDAPKTLPFSIDVSESAVHEVASPPPPTYFAASSPPGSADYISIGPHEGPVDGSTLDGLVRERASKHQSPPPIVGSSGPLKLGSAESLAQGYITGESLARTHHCVALVGLSEGGALVVSFGSSDRRSETPDCEALAKVRTLEPALRTFKLQ